MKKITVDRIEDKYALCEADNGELFQIELNELPEKTREGSIILVLSDGSYVLDNSATKKRINEMLRLQDMLFDD
ncbi:MAG: DUF3006 domain-containing protein [Clostridiales bacterium]|nr:DUF3006 domain-containing protein [Clostridiales bacterium]